MGNKNFNQRNLFFILLICYCIFYPSLSIVPEIWAEVGTNFYFNSIHGRFLDNLFIRDYSYLPFLQRLVSEFSVKILHITPIGYLYIVQLSSQIFIAYFVSFFMKEYFRSYIASDALRFFIALCIGLVPDYELHSFINFVYFGMFFLFSAFFINKTPLSRKSFFSLTVLSALLLLSKAFMIIFAPLYFIMLLLYIKKKKKVDSSLGYYSIMLLSSCIQVYFMLSAPLSQNLLFSFDKFLLAIYKTIYLYSSILTTTLIGYNIHYSIGINILLALMAFIFLIFTTFTLTRKYQKTSIFYMICISHILALIHIGLSILTLTPLYEIKINWAQLDNYSFHRFYFFPKVLIFLSLVVIIYYLFESKFLKIIFLSYIGLMFSIVPLLKFQDVYIPKYNSFSEWNAYSTLLKGSEYCIPINPYPWYIGYNCEKIYENNQRISRNTLENIDGKKWSAIILINPEFEPYGLDLNVFALGKNDKILGKGKLISTENVTYMYYKFNIHEDNNSCGIQKILFQDTQGNRVFVKSGLVVYGK